MSAIDSPVSKAPECPGLRWGPFTFRVPFYHTRMEWPELLQGIFVAGATGLGIVPLLMRDFGLNFEEAVACIFIQSLLISSAPILFGEPYAPGWITPALPLALAYVLSTVDGVPLYGTPTAKFQAMTAVSLNLAVILFFLGASGVGARFINWLPAAIKGGIIMGAAIAALKRVFLDDAEDYLYQQPVSTVVAISVCLILTFSAPIQQYKRKFRSLAVLAGLGLLPGFLAAAIVGPFVPSPQAETAAQQSAALADASDAASNDAAATAGPGEQQAAASAAPTANRTPREIEYNIQWGILVPPFASLFEKSSPFSIGWPSWVMFLDTFPLALMGYVILFGDLITGNEVLRTAKPARPDEAIHIDNNRSHLSLGIRNVLMALFAPFFPTQGCLWTGVHVIVVQRWSEGRKAMQSLFSGIASYYVFGVPVLYMVLPLLTGLRPLMGIALSLTLVLTGFACAYVAMGIPRTQIERGVVILMAVALAIYPNPWIGMTVGILATMTLVGFQRSEPEEVIAGDDEDATAGEEAVASEA